MGRKESDPSAPNRDNLERAMEILDEDHLEFEDILLRLQERTDHIVTQLKELAEKVSESHSEILENRETIETLEVKVDRLLAIVTEWRRERLDRPLVPPPGGSS